MKSFILPDLETDNEHLNLGELVNIIHARGGTLPAHLSDCADCRQELMEVFYDELSGIQAAIESPKAKFRLRALVDAGFEILQANIPVIPRQMPVMRSGEGTQPAYIGFRTLGLAAATPVFINISRPANILLVGIEPLTKFSHPVAFSLYNDGQLLETIALKNRGRGEIRAGITGNFRLTCDNRDLLEWQFLPIANEI